MGRCKWTLSETNCDKCAVIRDSGVPHRAAHHSPAEPGRGLSGPHRQRQTSFKECMRCRLSWMNFALYLWRHADVTSTRKDQLIVELCSRLPSIKNEVQRPSLSVKLSFICSEQAVIAAQIHFHLIFLQFLCCWLLLMRQLGFWFQLRNKNNYSWIFQ